MKNIRALGSAILLFFASLPEIYATAPSLQLLGVTAPRTLQMMLNGQDALHYEIEISTNLISWQPLLQLTPTNGSALFVHDGGAPDTVLFFRAYQRNDLQVQASPISSVASVVTSDGGTAELVTPDFRHITLSIPSGCVADSQEFTMTLITNVTGFPFSQGIFGAVALEPEGLALFGAASLQIDIPAGVDTRQVVSFGANNDGSTFYLAMDRLMTNKVLIPITRFATYGSGLATASELNDLLHPEAQVKSQAEKGSQPSCPADPTFNYFNISIPQSCFECFGPLVSRAQAVRADLLNFSRCTLQKNVAGMLVTARQQQLAGAPDDSAAILQQSLAQVCPLYTEKVAPLWPEAGENCALGTVLLGFMLGFERQLQLLGETNSTCPFTLVDNLADACTSAHECLREIADCCGRSKKGPGRVQEALSVIHTFTFEGSTCFGDDPLNDPSFQEVVRECLTNAWYGTVKIKQKGETETTSNNTLVTQSFDIDFEGQAFLSFETPGTPSSDGFLIVNLAGQATAKTHTTSFSDIVQTCQGGGTIHHYTAEAYDSVGMTNFLNGDVTNLNALASYDMEFVLKTNQTFQLLSYAGNDLTVSLTETIFSQDRQELCNGTAFNNTSSQTEHFSVAVSDVHATNGLFFPMTGPNTVSGAFDVTDVEPATLVPIHKHVEWDLRRNTNNPSFP